LSAAGAVLEGAQPAAEAHAMREELLAPSVACEEMDASALHRKQSVSLLLLRRASFLFCYHMLNHQLPKQSEQDLKMSFMLLI
jgi:hypothetical protein